MGNGQAAAGFSAVLARGVAAMDGGATRLIAIGAAGLALGLAALLAFFFFLADFFLPAAFFLAAFFDDHVFFFFFFPPFFAFFLAMLISFKVVEQQEPGRQGPDYPTAGGGLPPPTC